MFNVSRRFKRLLYLLFFLLCILYVKYLHSVYLENESFSSVDVDFSELRRSTKENYILSADYILLVKRCTTSSKSASHALLASLKLQVKVKEISDDDDSFTLSKPLPYLIILDDNTIVHFLKEPIYQIARNVIIANSVPIVAICANFEQCNYHARALLPAIAYYKSYVRTSDHELLEILKQRFVYENISSTSLVFSLSPQSKETVNGIQPLVEIPANNVDLNKIPENMRSEVKKSKLISAYYDSGKVDSIPKVVLGNDLKGNDWLYKVLFLEACNYVTKRKLSFGLTRLIQVDIDDVLMPAKLRENALTKTDINELIKFQKSVSSFIPNFGLKLGFCGDFFTRGRHPEEIEAFKYLARSRKDEFTWFPHLFRHYQPHNLTFNKLREEMLENKKFAAKYGIKVDGSYAVSPHHSGVYPVVHILYQLWKDIWNVSVTSTEQYPHLKSSHGRKGFIYNDISVLPRQVLGLYTRTLRFNDYPGGILGLERDVRGGDSFMTILLNPVAIYMTHIGNYGADRLALYALRNLFHFVATNTNLKLRSASPAQMAQYHFNVFPEQTLPVWTMPCDDKRHMEILPKGFKCDSFPQMIIVGPQKTGTSAFQFFLSAHPDFSTSLPSDQSFEEIQFFNNDGYYLKGIDWYKSRFPIMARSSQVNFEKSASYYDKYKVPHRIKSLLPNVKILMLLRNPIDRAYSWYLNEVSKMEKVSLTFSELIRSNLTDPDAPDFIFRSKVLTPGFYFKHIRRWLETFALKSVYFVDADFFAEKPAEELQKFIKWFRPEEKPVFNFSTIIEFNKEKGLYCLKKSVSAKNCLGASKGRSFSQSYDKLLPVDREFLRNFYMADMQNLKLMFEKKNISIPTWLRTWR